MVRLRRLLLMLLLACAVPMQGYAAAAMLHCLPGHGDAAVDKHHPSTGADEHHTAQQGAQPHAAHKCGSCATCGAAAMLPCAERMLLPDAPEGGVVSTASLLAVSFVSEGPERPPKPAIA